MALFTIPAVSKGTAATIQLNKTDLFALTPVVADAYFSVQANVDKVVVEFNSDPGNQKELLKFDMADAAPEASFEVSALARDSFLLERIILVDFDGGMLVLERSQLPSGFDITLGGGGGGGGGGDFSQLTLTGIDIALNSASDPTVFTLASSGTSTVGAFVPGDNTVARIFPVGSNIAAADTIDLWINGYFHSNAPASTGYVELDLTSYSASENLLLFFRFNKAGQAELNPWEINRILSVNI